MKPKQRTYFKQKKFMKKTIFCQEGFDKNWAGGMANDNIIGMRH